jgi:CoA-dependent NAD(P)H sulfur oxidoreductase
MSAKPKKLIVVGGVAGGTSAASRARRTSKDLEIVIYEKGEFVSYGACDEPYYIGGEVPRWEDLLVRAPEVFEQKQQIQVRLRHEVTAIDVAAQTVTIHNHQTGEEFNDHWDRLILATGARPRSLPLPGADLPGNFQLKFLPQARAIKEFITQEKPQKAVIIGAGYVGLEMAEALAQNQLQVTLLHRRELPGSGLEPSIARVLLGELEEKGVTFLPQAEVQRFEAGSHGRVQQVITPQETYPADLVLTAIGVEPVVELAQSAGVALGATGAIDTNERQETNIPGIYAAGDCCEVIHRVSGQPIFTPLGDIANKQGWCAGENAAGGEATYPGAIGSSHFKCFDLEIGVTGLNEEQARPHFDVLSNTTEHSSRAHPQPQKKKITLTLLADRSSRRLLGAQIVGKEGAALRINTLALAVGLGLTIDQLNEADLAYAPPFSPVIDPILVAARVLQKKLG